jgi:hypothetical protein
MNKNHFHRNIMFFNMFLIIGLCLNFLNSFQQNKIKIFYLFIFVRILNFLWVTNFYMNFIYFKYFMLFIEIYALFEIFLEEILNIAAYLILF